MSEEKKDFTVNDRRAFAGENPTEGEGEDRQTAPESETSESEAAASNNATESFSQMPEINFPTFLMSLNMSAMLHLGLIDDPTTGKKEKNLPMAKQTIDILSMLEEKTQGNRTEEEDKILKGILYDLRINFVRAKA